jgi:ribulose-5-phosphate 4-epimerase/fuculose-1-phosphate aldolase
MNIETTTTTNTNTVPTEVKPSSSKGYTVTSQGAHNISMGNPNPHQIPKFDDPYKQREWILEHMAGVFRVFGRKGYTEGSAGHISVRDPVDPNTFWINPLGIHFSLLKAADMVRVDEDGNIIGGNIKAPINAAGFAIHSSLHKARPDINAACHTHSPFGKAYSTFGQPLEMINQDVCTLYNNHCVYTDFGGVAIEKKEGEAIAKALGEKNRCVILQNHGLLTVGQTVDEAGYLYTLMERCCEVQLLADAAAAGGKEKKIIGDSEAAYTAYMNGDPETLYLEFQNDFALEKHFDDSFMTFTKNKDKN